MATSSRSSPSSLSSSTSTLTSTLTTANQNVPEATTTTPHTDSEQNISYQSLSASSSRSSSFSSGLDQLALINQSAHTFPANLTSLSSTSTDSSLTTTLSPFSNIRAARSTPSSPRLGTTPLHQHHERKAISRPSSPSFSRRSSGPSQSSSVDDSWKVRRKRARSWVNTPGAGFTPATISTSDPRNHMASNRPSRVHRHASTPEANLDALDHNRSEHNLRTRSTSASGSVTSNNNRADRLPRTRQPSFSARVSPVNSPLQPLTPMEAIADSQRTSSVPHLTRISPLIYGYSYHYPQQELQGGQQVVNGMLDGYFALPPPSERDPPNISPLSGEEMPPPYTASQVDLLASSNVNTNQDDHVRELQREEDDDNDEPVLSFSTQNRGSRDHQRSNEDIIRRRRHVDDDLDNSRAEVGSDHTFANKENQPVESSKMRDFILLYILHPLRLFAALPGCLGTFWLLRNAITLLWMNGTFWQIGNKPSALEFGLASLWSLTTAYHALSFTTLLLRRWLHYYSIMPSFIRLVALQAICWPLVRMTLYVVGPNSPLASWMIISTTTALSDTVARWVVSNITDEILSPALERDVPLHRSSINRRKLKKKRTGMAFWRVVMGGPSENYEAERNRFRRSPFTESEADSDIDLLRRGQGGREAGERATRSSISRPNATPNGFQSDFTSGGEESNVEQERIVRLQRVGRIFHWDVALRRNVLPIAMLAYTSLGVLLLEQVWQRA